jgi:hypothetical protein
LDPVAQARDAVGRARPLPLVERPGVDRDKDTRLPVELPPEETRLEVRDVDDVESTCGGELTRCGDQATRRERRGGRRVGADEACCESSPTPPTRVVRRGRQYRRPDALDVDGLPVTDDVNVVQVSERAKHPEELDFAAAERGCRAEDRGDEDPHRLSVASAMRAA